MTKTQREVKEWKNLGLYDFCVFFVCHLTSQCKLKNTLRQDKKRKEENAHCRGPKINNSAALITKLLSLFSTKKKEKTNLFMYSFNFIFTSNSISLIYSFSFRSDAERLACYMRYILNYLIKTGIFASDYVILFPSLSYKCLLNI
jgi:hypothetical protein